MIESKKVFISYSWGNKEHQEWVVDLGTRLMNDSVDVVLDRWDLKDGHDIFAFMEKMIKADDIFRVLIICDKKYSEKSDNRDGGVGTETQIITPELYSNQSQEKFIPIVVERDSEENPYLPIYLKSRKYIDFSSEEFFGSSYEELLRNILEAPALPKPKLATKAPSYITESSVNNTVTNSIVRTLDSQLKQYPEKINSYASDFTETFLEILWSFEFKSSSRSLEIFGRELEDNLKSYKIIREDFINFLLIITKQELDLDVDILINFFEKKTNYSRPRKDSVSWTESNYSNFKIIFQELFLYTVAVILKNKNYILAGELLHSRYFFYERNTGSSNAKRFTFLYEYNNNFESYYQSKHNRISGFGDYLITSLSNKMNKIDLILADTLCHYTGELFKIGDDIRGGWFPLTHLYKDEYRKFDFFERFSSKRHFEKIKPIFDVITPSELQQILINYKELVGNKERLRFGRGGFETIPYLFEVIDLDEIAKFK